MLIVTIAAGLRSLALSLPSSSLWACGSDGPRMAPKHAIFTVHSGSDADSNPASRSNSTDRNSQSPQRRPILLHHASSHGSGRHFLHTDPDAFETPVHHLVAVDEEAALEADGTAHSERDSLLGRGRQPNRDVDTPTKRRLTWSSGYGTTVHNGGAGGGHVANHEAGAAIKRQESILRVAGLIDDRSGEYEQYRKSGKELAKMSNKLRKFYEKQNETLVRLSSRGASSAC